jgi:EAL and modified HD-GYP domain-containing signal transduction protein
MEESFIYLGRQPILDRNKKIVAYEILYRKTLEAFARIEDENQATSRVIINIFNNIGIKNLTGNKKAFINVNVELLFYDIFEFIPPNNIVIEILEDTPVDNKVIERVKKIKDLGFELALDDFIETEHTKKLIPYVDYVKVDVLETKGEQLKRVAEILKKKNKKLVAEKVENHRIFEQTYNLGFDLFQGYFFAKPSIITHRRFDPYEITLINLLKVLNRKDPSIDEIEKIIKSDVHITFNLLRFVNSAYFSFKSKIKTIRHAVMMLGVKRLKIWVLLMLYADAKVGGIDNPLLELALMRGKILENIAVRKTKDRNFADMAFLTGVLSLIDILLGVSREEILSDLNIDEQIKIALLKEEGILGKMIKLCEYLESGDFLKLREELKEISCKIEEFFKAEEDAVLYVEEVKQKLLKGVVDVNNRDI